MIFWFIVVTTSQGDEWPQSSIFLIVSDFYLGFVREMVKRCFTTGNVPAGNKSWVEWTCNRPWGQSADICKVRVKFEAYCNLKFVYPNNIRSTVARLLRLWVRIPPRAWMSVCCDCCVLSSRDLGIGLITRPEESYRLWCVIVCDLETSWMRRPWSIGGCHAKNKKKNTPLKLR